MTVKYPPAIKIDLPKPSERESNVIYRWFQHQQGVENLEHRIVTLESELKAHKEALKGRLKLLEMVKAEVIKPEEAEE